MNYYKKFAYYVIRDISILVYQQYAMYRKIGIVVLLMVIDAMLLTLQLYMLDCPKCIYDDQEVMAKIRIFLFSLGLVWLMIMYIIIRISLLSILYSISEYITIPDILNISFLMYTSDKMLNAIEESDKTLNKTLNGTRDVLTVFASRKFFCLIFADNILNFYATITETNYKYRIQPDDCSKFLFKLGYLTYTGYIIIIITIKTLYILFWLAKLISSYIKSVNYKIEMP